MPITKRSQKRHIDKGDAATSALSFFSTFDLLRARLELLFLHLRWPTPAALGDLHAEVGFDDG